MGDLPTAISFIQTNDLEIVRSQTIGAMETIAIEKKRRKRHNNSFNIFNIKI